MTSRLSHTWDARTGGVGAAGVARAPRGMSASGPAPPTTHAIPRLFVHLLAEPVQDGARVVTGGVCTTLNSPVSYTLQTKQHSVEVCASVPAQVRLAEAWFELLSLRITGVLTHQGATRLTYRECHPPQFPLGAVSSRCGGTFALDNSRCARESLQQHLDLVLPDVPRLRLSYSWYHTPAGVQYGREEPVSGQHGCSQCWWERRRGGLKWAGKGLVPGDEEGVWRACETRVDVRFITERRSPMWAAGRK
ncbi:hypothetical protein Pcinc_030656 [Petrolisthes cinctipes]|uniref:Uncharacterized protein n=1 Tax=Petrolisthes cinctipes TaxID=88211 RepID=A0AAE1EXQ4_PETCI|nr:hypothetical protein Pcinc_030656 [Petrolisthes cinctipes]